jgi:hypothetical protein
VLANGANVQNLVETQADEPQAFDQEGHIKSNETPEQTSTSKDAPVNVLILVCVFCSKTSEDRT